jgi:hypothetical protein
MPAPTSMLLRRVVSFARSPQGRRAVDSAVRYARSEKGQRQLAAARERVNRARAARSGRRPPQR